jgi:tRNA pseudouridine55 synthase
MHGILLVDKPVGWTSFDVVNYVRKIVAHHEGKKPKQIKVGHTGTLDPFATGLLVLLIGKDYTRQANSLSKLDKSYSANMKLGAISSTGDPEGNISILNDKVPSRAELNTIVKQFIGNIEQIPPAFSAIKINGQRAYKLARAGQEVALKPRTTTIYRLEVDAYKYPDVQLKTDVSSGTYIRTLVEDIGKNLSTGAYTLELRRESVGDFQVNQSLKIEDIDASKLEDRLITIDK